MENLYNKNILIKGIAKKLKVSYKTVYRYLKKQTYLKEHLNG